MLPNRLNSDYLGVKFFGSTLLPQDVLLHPNYAKEKSDGEEKNQSLKRPSKISEVVQMLMMHGIAGKRVLA